jgi:hypothetical protein
VAGGKPGCTRFPTRGDWPRLPRSTLEERGDGVYIAEPPKPGQGWIAYFIELTFPSRVRKKLPPKSPEKPTLTKAVTKRAEAPAIRGSQASAKASPAPAGRTVYHRD